MVSWTKKGVKDLSLEDRMEMIEAFSNSLREFYIVCNEKNEDAAEFIARTLIETFAIIIMGEDVIKYEDKITEIERNLNDQFKALA
jgi:hypothetical protein|tara:strand:- start:161 stop:418 length:258 start_codon:yes stop_codon:yes gene_type:complete